MGENWLDRLLPPSPPGKERRLPSLDVRRPLPPAFLTSGKPGELPNASLIYGVAAAALVAISLYFLFTEMWFTGVLLLLPAGCLLGFALHYLRYPT
jgi:hypothetical protein